MAKISKYGKWEKCKSTPSKVKCSVCGYKHEWVVTVCPNCEAKMTGAARNEKR